MGALRSLLHELGIKLDLGSLEGGNPARATCGTKATESCWTVTCLLETCSGSSCSGNSCNSGAGPVNCGSSPTCGNGACSDDACSNRSCHAMTCKNQSGGACGSKVCKDKI